MIGTNLAITTKNYAVGGAVTYDTDALAYFTANTAITSDADKTAINTFYLGLKSDGIYTKIKAMYLPIWGSAASSKWNLVNPLDTNAAYRLTFATGMSHASNGFYSNGTTGYANSYYSTNNIQNSNHLSIYIQTDVNESKVDIGAYQSSPGRAFDIESRVSNLHYNANFIALNFNTYANTNSKGFYINTRTTSLNQKSYKNGILKATDTSSGTNNFNREIFICCRNEQGTPNFYSTKIFSFISIGDNGLTDAESSNFYNRVQTLMTYFGINV